MHTLGIRRDVRKTEQDLIEQVRAAFGEGVGEEDGDGTRRAREGAAEVVAEVFGEQHVSEDR